jgi:hypothetical protein
MSKKPSRRKKARPVKKRPITFRISVEAQPIVVRYEPHSIGDMASFEYRSPYRPRRRIPFSDTGYFSHHASMERVKAAKSPQDFARNELLALLRYGMKSYSREIAELPLF